MRARSRRTGCAAPPDWRHGRRPWRTAEPGWSRRRGESCCGQRRRRRVFGGEARVARDPLAAFVLAVTSIEALTDDPPWSLRQEQMLAHAVSAVTTTGDGSQQEIEEVAQRIRTLHKVGVMQGFKRLLVTLDRLNLWPRWKRLYSETRSAFLQGDMPQPIDGDAIHEAMTLSKEIVLAAAR